MKRIAFFFGAGAEGKGNFNISTGLTYLKSSLYASKTLEGFNEALASFFSNQKYFNGTYKYRKDTLDVTTFLLKNFIVQKSINDIDFYYTHNELILALLDDEDIRHICDELEIEDIPKHSNSKDYEQTITGLKEKLRKILIGTIESYSDINDEILCQIFMQGKDDKIEFDLNIGIAGSLDSYFHTIIDPYKYGPIKFSRIFNYYWACYFTILHDVLKFFIQQGKIEFESYFTAEGQLNYLMVLRNLQQLTKMLYNINVSDIAPTDSYYQLIHQELQKHKDKVQCAGVITSNYYKFAEIVYKEPIYLNGQLNLFEYPELLEVVNIADQEYTDRILFPFVFGQSLVKPIVNPVQTEAFHRFNNLLNGNNSVDILVIIGFNINEDDNHINAFLHQYVQKGKKLIVVTKSKPEDIAKRLKCSGSEPKIHTVAYGNNQKTVADLFDKITNEQ